MNRSGMNRRRFLETSGQAAAGAAIAASAGGTVAITPQAVMAATKIISTSQAATLLAMARHLFPHNELGDHYYAAAVALLDEQAAADADVAAQLATGVGSLDSAMGMPFVKLSRGNQLKVIESLEGTPFFATVRAATLGALYTDDVVTRQFGFEGSSVEHGGYIDRGFDDLGWLPELPGNA
jgi:hypothetical protein